VGPDGGSIFGLKIGDCRRRRSRCGSLVGSDRL